MFRGFFCVGLCILKHKVNESKKENEILRQLENIVVRARLFQMLQNCKQNARTCATLQELGQGLASQP